MPASPKVFDSINIIGISTKSCLHRFINILFATFFVDCIYDAIIVVMPTNT